MWKSKSLSELVSCGSMKEQGSRAREVQSRAAASSLGRWFSKKARAFSGTEKVALRSLSLGWWIGSSGMEKRGQT